MNLNLDSSVIITNNIEALKSFYAQFFKLEIEYEYKGYIKFKCGLALWKLDSEHIITKNQGYKFNPDGNRNFEICFDTSDFDDVVKQLKGKGVKLLHEINEESWGQRTIRFFDPDNNLVEVGENIRSYVNRLIANGLSETKVAEKTDMTLEDVRHFLND